MHKFHSALSYTQVVIVLLYLTLPCRAFSDDFQFPREAVICGPNALAILLSIHGLSKDDAFFDAIDCRPNGASLLELRNAARSAGINAEVRKVHVSELTFPAILQTVGSEGRNNHYMVAYKRAFGKTCVIDATTGRCLDVRDVRFDKYFSGYVLVSEGSHFDKGCRIASWLLITFSSYQATLLLWRRFAKCQPNLDV